MATQNKSADNRYAQYKANKTWEKNRKRRLEALLKKQPNNEQIKNALGGMVYRRKTPNTKVWSASWIRIAKIFKEIEGRFDPNIMSANVDIARAALQRQSKVSAEILRSKKPQAKVDYNGFFSIATRIGAV